MTGKTGCAAFQPPPPLSMGGYLNDVVGKAVTDPARSSVFSIEDALRTINARPSIPERVALLQELVLRYERYGIATGLIEKKIEKKTEEIQTKLSKFVIEDLVGLKTKSAEDKAKDALTDPFKKKLEEFVKEGLNDRGRNMLVFFKVIYDLANCKDSEEVGRVLGKTAIAGIGAWIAKHGWSVLAKVLVKRPLPAPIRQRIVRYLAITLIWDGIWSARIASLLRMVNPFLLAADILLTPTETASDREEQRLGFLYCLALLHRAAATTSFGLVRSCTGAEWQYRLHPSDYIEWKLNNPPGHQPASLRAP